MKKRNQELNTIIKKKGALKINQIKTIENLIRIRTEKNITQTKIAKDMGVSRTHYCNIENGNRVVTEEYLKIVAKHLGVSYNELVVYEEDYNKGFSDALEYVKEYVDKDYLGLKSFVFNFASTGDRVKYSSLLYPFLYSLGYEIYVLESNIVWKKYNHPVPCGVDENGEVEYSIPDIDDYFEEPYVYLIVKDGKGLTYCSPKDFKRFEKLVQNQIDVYFDSSFKYFVYETGTTPQKDNIDNESLIDQLKKQLADIKEYTKICEQLIEREEQNEKSKRNGDDL